MKVNLRKFSTLSKEHAKGRQIFPHTFAYVIKNSTVLKKTINKLDFLTKLQQENFWLQIIIPVSNGTQYLIPNHCSQQTAIKEIEVLSQNAIIIFLRTQINLQIDVFSKFLNLKLCN